MRGRCGDGHVRPFLPLLAALREAGHELAVVTLDDSVGVFESAGFDTVGVRPSRPRIDPMEVAVLAASDRPAYVIESFLATAIDFARVILDEFSDRSPDVLVRENVGWGAWLAGACLPVRSLGPEDTIDSIVSTYRATWLEVDAIADTNSLDEPCRHPDWRGSVDLRWVLMHLLEETARHAGHADIVRELIDGSTGR